MGDRLAGAVARTLPTSRQASDLAAAVVQLQTSIGRLRNIVVTIGEEHAIAAEAHPIPRVKNSLERLSRLTAGLATELGYTATTIGIIHKIIESGR